MKRGEKSLSKKIKLKLWIAIIIAVCVLSYCITTVAVSVFSKNKNGFLTFQGVEYNVENLGYVISEWKGNDGKSDGRQSLIQSSVTDLMNAKLNHKEGDDPIIYKSVICMSHGVSNKVTNTGIYNVKTVIDIDYDDSYKSVIMKTYNSNGKKQVASAANTANGRAIGAKLAYAIVQNEQYTENGTGSDQKYSKYKNQVILYLRQAISSSMISANNIFLGQDTKLDNIDGATPTDKDKNVTNTFKSNIEAITAFKGLKNVSDKDATERTTILTLNSVRYVRIGPFKVTYGGNPVSSVKINGSKATNVYFAKYDSSKTAEEMEKEYAKASTWNNDLSKIPNNAYFYLAIKKSELPTANGDYTLSLHQDGISYRRARALLLEINSGQQLAVVANGGAKATGKVQLTYTVEHKDKAELIIIKQDKMTEKKLSGVKLKVYGESSDGSGKGWVGSNGSLVTYENSSTFTTNKDGKVTITKIPPGKYYVYEIGTASGYDLENQRHYFPDSNDDKKVAGRANRDNAVYIASVTLARAGSKTITKNQYPSSKLTVKKVDYDNTDEKLDGIKFGIYLNRHGWLVYDSKTQSFSYSDSTRTAFETGKSYCGIAAVKGQFTLKGLLVGDYKIMEIGTTDDYVLSEQPGYDSNDGKKFVRCGQTSYKAGYTTVYLSDGKTKYNFRRVKYADNTDNKSEYFDYIHLDCYESSSTKSNGDIYYGTNYATFVVKNKKSSKDTSLNIRKLDNDSNAEISGAKFKVLVKLTQDEKVGTTTFKKDSYAWVKNQNGELTTDVSQALEVQTDVNGKSSIKKLPYGKYYVYETQSIDGYTMENQEGYNSGKPSDYTGTFLNGNWVYVGTTTISSTLKSVTLEAKNAKDGNDGELSIKKSDKNSNGNISGAKFKILVKLQQNRKIGDTTFKKDSYAWVKNQNGELTTDVTQALELQTNDGLAVVGKLSYGSYYVYETAAADGYTLESQDGYKTGKPSDYTGTFLSDEWVYVGTTTISSTSKSIALNVKNLKTSIKIIKKDEKKRQIVNNSNYYLGGAKIKIYGSNLADNTSGWLKQNGKKYEYTNYENATTFTTDSQTGEINIQGIKKGSYYIYEIGAPEGYILNRQDGYKVAQKGSSEIKDADWVYLGTTTVSTENNQVEASVENNKYIDIKGKVWVDKPDADKASSAKYNNIYDNQDILLSNITVKLIDNNTNNVIATTITNQSGEYTFSRKNNNEKINYWEAQSYHIEFTYDNKQYITVQPFIGDNNVNSKAQEWKINNDELDDEKLTGEGVAVTYKGNNYNNSNNKQLTSYYNEGTGTIENINLGLIEKVQPDHVIGEEIEYVKITKGDYTFKYKYGDEAVIDGNDQKNQSSVMFENSSKSFTQAIYPTDIAYNVANGLDGNDPNAYKVYIVYKISIKNICSWNNEYLYKEKSLYLDTLSVQYDSKYELSNVTWDDDGNSSDFTLWQQQQGRVLFDIDSARNKKFNSNNEGIKPGETENVYVQFKVKNEALIQLTQMPGENKEISIATSVTDHAFHQYERKDMNWQNNNTYVHKSLYEIRENSSLSIRLKLADSRTVSGVIFEDSKDNTRPNERVGDGKYSDGENKLSDVLVSLMEVKDDGTESLAYVYDGNLSYDANSGKWKASKKYAQVIVTESQAGTYQFNGIVPGKYYLKFTYGDGTTEIKNIDGSTTTANLGTKSNGQKIDSSKYKSTIITGAAKDASNEYWYLNQDKTANYSVATDKEDVIRNRTTSTSEIKNSTTSVGILIEASSPKMNVKFEYITRDESNYNDKDQLYGDCSGMSFGIIERPRVDIQLEKNVKSVKYTLSNGTTLINGDSNNSPYIARVDDSYVKLELKESYIYGSQAEVKYELKIKNNSEIDYATSDYYKYGTTNRGDTPVSTTVTKIIDYLDNNGCNYASIDEKLQKSESDSDYEGGKETYFTEEAINYNKKYKSQLLKVQGKDLIPMEADTTRDKSNSTETYVMAINKLLSDRDKYGWESTSEIIGIKNVTNTSQYECTMGNYKVGDIESKENGGTNESDNGNGIISISEPTGSDKSYTKYIFAGTMIIILGIGIVCIKKFVL